MTAFIRNPDEESGPSHADPERLKVYRDLFSNNIESFLKNQFSALHKFYEAGRWNRLVRSFIRDHCCRSPYFHHISREFLSYILYEYRHEAADPPFLADWVHYRWLWLALDVTDVELPEADIDRDGDLLSGSPVLSPLLCSLRYNYPVHKFTGTEQLGTAEQGGSFHLLLWRDRQYKVRQMESNAATAKLLEFAATGRGSGEQYLLRIAKLLDVAEENRHTVLKGGAEVLEDLRQRDAILGSRPSASRGATR